MAPLPAGLDPAEYWLASILAVAAALAAFWFGWRNWRRARLIEDAPTAKIRSAHQGYVELEGSGRLMDGAPIIAPLTAHHCLWYRYKIERKDTYHTKHGTRSKWTVIRQETSDNLFLLDDGSGRCVIDPDGAEITTDEKLCWYGDSPWPAAAPLLGSGSVLMGGNFRYTEWLILEGQPLYAIGMFKTMTPTQLYGIAEQTRDLIRAWKGDQAALLARFDVDKDGRIDQDEWTLVRHAAKLQAQQEYRERSRQPDLHILTRPEDGRHPYLLSVYPQDRLSKRYRLHAYLCLAGFFTAGAAAAWLLRFSL